MDNQQIYSYFGHENGYEVSTTKPKFMGLGRGYRPRCATKSQTPFLGRAANQTLPDNNARFSQNDHELNRIHQTVQNRTFPRGISAASERLPMNAPLSALSFVDRRDRFVDARDADFQSRQQSAFQRRGRHETRHCEDGPFGRAIRIPIFLGEIVVVYVSSETCWIPMRLLERIFYLPGTVLGCVCGCFILSCETKPDNSICYQCLRVVMKHFQSCLSDETRPILEHLQFVLDRRFIQRNGVALCKSPIAQCITEQHLSRNQTGNRRNTRHLGERRASCRNIERSEPRPIGEDMLDRLIAACVERFTV